MLRKSLLKLIEMIPPGARQKIKQNRVLGRMGSAALRKVVSSGEPIVVTIQQGPSRGMKLIVDEHTPRYYWLEGHDEPDVVAVLQQSTPSGGTVLDIGAHVGTETLMFSRWVGESGKVIAVEADPKTAARLQSNLQLNNLSNVQMIAKAISNHVGTVRFSADVTVTSAVADSAAQSSTVEIPCDTIDHLDQSLGLGRIDLIKIDVEDHEVAVLDGAVQTLRDKSPVWIVEIHSPASLHGCVERFEAAGYRVQNVEPDAAAILASKNPDPAQFHRFHLLARRP